MKKLKISTIILFFLFTFSLNAQIIRSASTTKCFKSVIYTPTKSNPTSTTTEYINAGAAQARAGITTQFLTNPQRERETFDRSRAYFALWNLNLAANETVDYARLYISTSYPSGSGNFNVTFIGNTSSATDAPSIWNEYGSGSSIGSLPYNGSGEIDVTNIIKNHLSSGVYFGFYEGDTAGQI